MAHISMPNSIPISWLYILTACLRVSSSFSFFAIIIIIIIIILLIWEFFILASADGFSLEFEWQQVSSSLQDSSQYSGRYQ